MKFCDYQAIDLCGVIRCLNFTRGEILIHFTSESLGVYTEESFGPNSTALFYNCWRKINVATTYVWFVMLFVTYLMPHLKKDIDGAQ